jgi:hypothetical protein
MERSNEENRIDFFITKWKAAEICLNKREIVYLVCSDFGIGYFKEFMGEIDADSVGAAVYCRE